MGLVDDQRVVAAQLAVALQLGEQDAVGHHPHAASRRRPGRRSAPCTPTSPPIVVPSSSATRSAIVRAATRRGWVWPISPSTPRPELEAQLRQLRALARSGLAGDDDHLVVADRGHQLVTPGRDRQDLGIGQPTRREEGVVRARRGPAPPPALELVATSRAIEVSGCRSENAPGGRDHRRAVALRPVGGSSRSIGPLTLTAASRRPCGVDHRRADRGHAGLALLDALDPAAGPSSPDSTRPAEPTSSGSSAPSGTIQRSPWGDCSDTTQRRPSPSRTNSCTLSPVSSRRRVEHRPGAASASGKPSAAARPSADERRARGEAAVVVAPQQAVLLERRGETVGRRPRQAGRAPAARPSVGGSVGSTAREHVNGLVEHADARYDVHTARTLSQRVGRAQCQRANVTDDPAREGLGAPPRPRRTRRARPALHRPAPRARGHQPAGLRRPAPQRPHACAAPTSRSPPRTTTSRPADIDQPIADPISAKQVDTLRAQHRRVRHHQLPDGRPRPGHRPRHRPRAGPHACRA